MTDTPVVLIAFLALGAVAVVLALLLVRSQQELGRAELHAEAVEMELDSAARHAAALDARLRAAVGELRHLVDVRIPELADSLAEPDAPPPGPSGTKSLPPELARAMDTVLAQVREAVVKERLRVDAAAQATLRGAATTIQTLLHRLHSLLRDLHEKYAQAEDPAVADDLVLAGLLTEQALRRVQSTAVVCGAYPGPVRESSPLAQVVVTASARLSGGERVEVNDRLRGPLAVVPRAVEPLAVTLTELIANALHHSHPELPVTVTLQQGDRGTSVIVDDAGVGMTDEEFARAKRLLSGEGPILITELGDPPRGGFATVGQLVRQYGFRAHAEASPYGGVRTVVHLPEEPLLTLLDGRADEYGINSRNAESSSDTRSDARDAGTDPGTAPGPHADADPRTRTTTRSAGAPGAVERTPPT